MKVLFINTVYGQGSTGRIVADLGQMLEDHGHEFKVAYGRGRHASDPHCYRIGNDLDLYFHAAMARFTDRAGFYSTHATKKLLAFIREYNPDIIHLHNLHGYYLNVEVLFGYLANEYKGRVIWTLHDCWAFTGHCVYYTYAGCDKWKTGCKNCPQKHEYPASFFLDNSSKNFQDKKRLFTSVKNLEIVTVSNWLREEVLKSFLSSLKVQTIYNGVDIGKFHYVHSTVKKKLDIEGKKMILLVSDGWNERKGYSKVLEVAQIAPKDWLFVMIGLDEKQINGLPENIRGFQRLGNQDELVAYYSAADVFFNPSREETFGLVTAEATACGTPVVVMNSTACPEVAGDENTGIVLERNATLDEYIQAICKGMGLKSNIRKINFTMTSFWDHYRRLYDVLAR